MIGKNLSILVCFLCYYINGFMHLSSFDFLDFSILALPIFLEKMRMAAYIFVMQCCLLPRALYDNLVNLDRKPGLLVVGLLILGLLFFTCKHE